MGPGCGFQALGQTGRFATSGRSLSNREEKMLSRRLVLAGLAPLPLAACNTVPKPTVTVGDDVSAWYTGYLPDEPHPIPLVDRKRMRPELNRQIVPYRGAERPGTIVVDIDERFLFLVQGDGTAIRYGVGVGKQGFSWKGVATVGRKGVWPDWRPTATMVSLNRDLPRFRKAGLDNPLGARALYLYQNGRDILF